MHIVYTLLFLPFTITEIVKPYCNENIGAKTNQTFEWHKNGLNITLKFSNKGYLLILHKHNLFDDPKISKEKLHLNHYVGFISGYGSSKVYGWIDHFFYGVIEIGSKIFDIEKCDDNPIIIDFENLMKPYSNLLIDYIENKYSGNHIGHVSRRNLNTDSSDNVLKTKNICNLGVYVDQSIPQNEHNLIYTVIQRANKLLTNLQVIKTTNSTQYIQFKIVKFEINQQFKSRFSQDSLLEEFSLLGHDKTCASVLFTNVDFNNGVAGVAYVGQSKGKVGGVCDGRSAGVPSFNTLIVTNVVFKRKLPIVIQDIVLIHEFGHSIGSSHDKPSDSKCSPSILNGGAYLMFPRTPLLVVSPNNIKFSPCTIEEVTDVIQWKAEKCFSESTLCGNQRLDENEECDCGHVEECKDNCCNASICKLKYYAKCSPQNGECCDIKTCTISSSSTICEDATSCAEKSYCSGLSVKCPKANNVKDGTNCLNDHICQKGICTYNPCNRFMKRSCKCNNSYSNDTDASCNECCIDNDNICKPINNFDINLSVLSKAGKICGLNDEGLCDRNAICRLEPSEITLLKLYKARSQNLFDRIMKKMPFYLGISCTTGFLVSILMLGLMRIFIKV